MKTVVLLSLLSLASADKSWYFYNLNTGESSNDLPACVGIMDPKNERPYWIVNNVPTWEATPECSWHAANTSDIPPNSYYFNSLTMAVKWERPDALSWVNMSRDPNKMFWINSVTTETTRKTPKVLGHEDKTRGGTYYIDKNGKVTWDKPVEAQWIEGRSESHGGQPYYYNPILNKTVWEMPPESSIAWQTWHDFEHITHVTKDEL